MIEKALMLCLKDRYVYDPFKRVNQAGFIWNCVGKMAVWNTGVWKPPENTIGQWFSLR